MSKTKPARFDFEGCRRRTYEPNGEFMFYEDYVDLEKHYEILKQHCDAMAQAIEEMPVEGFAKAKAMAKEYRESGE